MNQVIGARYWCSSFEHPCQRHGHPDTPRFKGKICGGFSPVVAEIHLSIWPAEKLTKIQIHHHFTYINPPCAVLPDVCLVVSDVRTPCSFGAV
jgi:hypothetical protein